MEELNVISCKLLARCHPARVTVVYARVGQFGWVFALLLLLSYYWYWVSGALSEGFTHDDLMNIYSSLFKSWSDILTAMATVWKPSPLVRPMGGLVYRLVWDAIGFVPGPFHVLCLSIGFVNIILVFCIIRILLRSDLFALLSAWFLAYHGEMYGMYSNTGVIFDLLAILFYFSALMAALWNPVSLAKRIIQVILILLFAVAALNSKEVAVSLPLAVAAILILKTDESTITASRMAAAIRFNLPCLGVLSALTALFVFGRVLGSGGVAEVPAYNLSLSASHFITNFSGLLSALSYGKVNWNSSASLVVLIAPSVAFALARWKWAFFSWLMVPASFLPLAFIPSRGMDASYLTVFWSSLAIVTALRCALPRRPVFRIVPALAILAITVGHVSWGRLEFPVFKSESESISRAYTGISMALSRVHGNARIAFVEDHFEERFEWATSFMAFLATRHEEILIVRAKDLRSITESDTSMQFDVTLKVTQSGVLSCIGSDHQAPTLSQILAHSYSCAPIELKHTSDR